MERIEGRGTDWVAAYRLSPMHNYVLREEPGGAIWIVDKGHMWQFTATSEGTVSGPFDDV